ncbi:UNVERIFIED_CONTAM: hypothetical protein PYX00_004900 [Menopon gallinae]
MDLKPAVENIFVQSSMGKRKTFEGDVDLPSLPLPELQHTLSRYLDSLKPFTTPAEYLKSFKIVEEFERGIGAELNEKLKEKANNEKNWVEKWWENYGYLKMRDSLLPYSNMIGVAPKMSGCCYGTEEDQIRNAALISYYTVNFCVLLRRQELKPSESMGGQRVFSMSQFRRLFCTVRRPGLVMDSLGVYFRTLEEGPCPSNVVIMCRGRFFNVNAIDEKGYTITPPEWEEKIREVLKICEDEEEPQNIGILTCDLREKWCKYREHILQSSDNNRNVMDIIERCLFVLVLDEDKPQSVDEVPNFCLNGDYNNRWADKSMSIIIFKNGFFGTIYDHTAFDGIASITCMNYIYRAISENMGEWLGSTPDRDFPTLEELKFDVDAKIMRKIKCLNKDLADNKKIGIYRKTFDDYGKIEIQRFGIHPDSFVQMALQLTYYRLYRKPAPCYETATTRAFFNGRTETLRSCTSECVDWVKAMLKHTFNISHKAGLLMEALKRHDQLMSEARTNAGCDRHLFGLYCTALEEGMPIPELYNDPSYFKSGGAGNFILSTSCTGYTAISGGVAPMCKDGYGIFYNILPDSIVFIISENLRSKETNAETYFSSLKRSLLDMRFILLYSNSSKL